jgi:hypothetical protein
MASGSLSVPLRVIVCALAAGILDGYAWPVLVCMAANEVLPGRIESVAEQAGGADRVISAGADRAGADSRRGRQGRGAGAEVTQCRRGDARCRRNHRWRRRHPRCGRRCPWRWPGADPPNLSPRWAIARTASRRGGNSKQASCEHESSASLRAFCVRRSRKRLTSCGCIPSDCARPSVECRGPESRRISSSDTRLAHHGLSADGVCGPSSAATACRARMHSALHCPHGSPKVAVRGNRPVTSKRHSLFVPVGGWQHGA